MPPQAQSQDPQMPPQAPPQFAPPMAAPASPPGIPTDQSVGMSQEEMKANLQQMLSKLTAEAGNFKAQHFAVGNKMQEQGGQMLRDLFDFFTSIGVDPSVPEEVSAYLEKLRQQSPELAAQLETLLKRILGNSESAQATVEIGATPDGVQPPQDMNNIDANAQNLPQNL